MLIIEAMLERQAQFTGPRVEGSQGTGCEDDGIHTPRDEALEGLAWVEAPQVELDDVILVLGDAELVAVDGPVDPRRRLGGWRLLEIADQLHESKPILEVLTGHQLLDGSSEFIAQLYVVLDVVGRDALSEAQTFGGGERGLVVPRLI